MSDREALERAICAAPAEDTPRLALADWLDEHAAPGRAGDGDRARAVYIRDSVHLDAVGLPGLRCARTDGPLWNGRTERPDAAARPRCRCAVCARLRRRARAAARGLLTWAQDATREACRMVDARWGAERDPGAPAPRTPAEWAADWERYRLPRLERYPAVWFRRGCAEILHAGAEVLPVVAGALFARAPITRVVLEPGLFAARAGRVALRRPPAYLAARLTAGAWADEDAARDAVSAACVALGREHRDRLWTRRTAGRAAEA